MHAYTTVGLSTASIRLKYHMISGADPGFQVRGGAHLKKWRRAEVGAKIVCGISCEKSRFDANKSYFFQLRREARKYLGYFV